MDRTHFTTGLDSKPCSRCKQVLPRTAEFFHRHKQVKDGLRVECKVCHRKNVKADQTKHPETHRAYLVKHAVRIRRRNAVRKAVIWARVISKECNRTSARARFGLSDIDETFIMALFKAQAGRCHWYGLPMVPSAGNRDPQRPSLDRLDCSKGYVRGNVVLACAAANMGRSNATPERFAEFCKALKEAMNE